MKAEKGRSEKVRNTDKAPAPGILIFLCWLTYTSAYLGRYSYNSNITNIIDAYRIDHASAGLVTTCFFFAYGAGQVINGILCKRYHKRVVISFVLIVSSILNLAVFLGVPFFFMKYLWLCNGLVQSVLWPTLVLALAQSLEEKYLEKSVIVMSTTAAAGTFLTYGLSAILAHIGSYRISFLIGAVAPAIVSILWFAFYRDFPGRAAEKPESEKKEKHSVSRDSSLLTIIIILGVFAVANNLVKDGLTTWVPSILKEQFGLPDSLSIFLTLALPLLGLFGAACSTLLAKRIPSFITSSGLWYLFTALFIGIVMAFVHSGLWVVALAAFGLISLFMYAVNNAITSIAPLYMRDQINSGFMAGLLNGCCYVGSTASSYGLGAVADHFGWNGVFTLLLAVSCVPVIIAIVDGLVQKLRNRQTKNGRWLQMQVK